MARGPERIRADKLADDFAAGPWNKLQYNNKPYALPIDSGPEMFFYNKAVFDKAGVDGESIKTWNDYYEAAKKIRATGSYITNLAGTSNDYQPFTAQIWQAGAQPWKVDGENITINMTKDEGMQRYIQFVQKLIDEDLVDAKTPNWSDDWNRELNDGTLASLTIGAWMPINLMTGAPDQAATGASPSCRSGRKARKSPPKTVALHLPSPRSPRTRPLPTSSLST